MKNHFLKLIDYDHHTNQTLVKLIIEAGEPEKAVKLMAHMLMAQQVWFNRCNYLPAPNGALWPDWKADTFEQIINDNHAAWVNFLSSLDGSAFQNIIYYKTFKGDSFENKMEDIIQSSAIENLDIVMAGPVPPNPAELIASERCDELFRKLKEIYDFIIIDTPPVGLVTDAFLLTKYTDANVFVVRQNYTLKKVFGAIIKDIETRKSALIQILINDVRLDRGSYGYGYGYGYGYYSDDDTKGKKKSFFSKDKKT